MTIDRRGFLVWPLSVTLFSGHPAVTNAGHLAPRDVPILSGRVSGRTSADVEDGIFDLARATAIAVPPGTAAHHAMKELLGLEVDVIMRVKA